MYLHNGLFVLDFKDPAKTVRKRAIDKWAEREPYIYV